MTLTERLLHASKERPFSQETRDLLAEMYHDAFQHEDEPPLHWETPTVLAVLSIAIRSIDRLYPHMRGEIDAI